MTDADPYRLRKRDPAPPAHPGPLPPGPRPELRASDADRDVVAERLRDAAAEGRIGLDELDDRLTSIYQAKTYGELEAVVADLPPSGTGLGIPSAGSGEPMVLRAGVGRVQKSGHWQVPTRIVAGTETGTVRLDFSEASCPHREVDIQLEVGAGSVQIQVPRDWAVNTDRVAVGSGGVANRPPEPPHPNAPQLTVHGSVGHGSVRVRYVRRGSGPR